MTASTAGPAPVGPEQSWRSAPTGPAAGAGIDQPLRLAAAFAHCLRRAGIAVPTGSAVELARALALVGMDHPSGVYWAGRATLVRRPEDFDLYDRVFSAYWTGITPVALPAPGRTRPLAVDDADEAGGDVTGDPSAPPGEQVRSLRWSAAEVLAERDLAALSAEEWAEAHRLIAALRVGTDLRPSRRSRPSRHRAGSSRRPDLRRTVRASLRHGGVPVRRVWRRPLPRPRRMVFLLDVSGSMESYSRAMARFAHAAVSSRRAGRVEVFTLGTRLTRVTREMSQRDPDAALRSAGRSATDWSGGTRLGDSLGQFNDRWGVRGLARGSVVVICSDGWDRGDPSVMAAEMARLSRVAHRVVWVNPLKASPGYAPLVRGMAAALPYVDQFVDGHSIRSLGHLAELVAGGGRPR